jgi:ATP-dependent 26S proteasome regulatory subunit
VDTKLFSKIRYFLDNRDVYERRGIPYTCGFVLYGPPGTGKTSIIKTLATEYSLPIIIVNLNNVGTITDLKKMFEAISTNTQSYSPAPYLLVFEDFDRSKFFNERMCMDAFYNLLDGIEEMTGRIAIITCNNHIDILNDRALCRPGRFDTILHITYATQSQIQRMLQVFYDDQTITFDTPDSERMNPITPAEIQDILFSNSTDVEAAKREIVGFRNR